MKNKIKIILLLIFALNSCTQITDNEQNTGQIDLKNTILKIHENYVEGWKNSDEELVMSLFEDNAMIQPNSLKPKKGKAEMREFWFPKDGSVTTIDSFQTEILNLEFLDTLAVTTHHSYLDWDYVKDSTQFGMIQKGIVTTVYRKQKDDSWKIWRQMWTDIFGEVKK